MRGEGRATEEGGETGEGQRKEKTTSDDKVVTPVAQRSWVPGPWDRAGLRRGVGSSESWPSPCPGVLRGAGRPRQGTPGRGGLSAPSATKDRRTIRTLSHRVSVSQLHQNWTSV